MLRADATHVGSAGGCALAYGTTTSKFADVIAEQLAQIEEGVFLFLLILITVTCFTTELVSNVATVSIFGAVTASTAVMAGHDPVQCSLAVTFAASFAFMLPMATAPNMVGYSTGKISLGFMAKNGFAVNIVCIIIGTCWMAFVAPSVLQQGGYWNLPIPKANEQVTNSSSICT